MWCVCFRSRNEIKEEVKRLIHCLKSQHITCEEAMKQLFEYVALNPSNLTLPMEKQVNDVDENKQKPDNRSDLFTCRMGVYIKECVDYEVPPQRECSAEDGNEPYTRLVDEQGNMNIAVVEGEGYRVYRLNKTAQNRELYKCADCDLLHKTKKDPIAQVEIVDGILIGDIHPSHHPRCPLQTLSVKDCEQNSDVEEGRRGDEAGKSTSAKRTPKQSGRRSRQTTKSPVRKRPHVVPERSLGMTLRKRRARTLTSPGIYDSEVMS
ncbi:unnamed protein product [Brugia timori]|uniref:Tudor domain-containing protein n=1 Tax=Brugia timori TaxID=42155 RepID=A0A0R3R1M8_9BILA|nr:unnamed protein product [Brugia timori]